MRLIVPILRSCERRITNSFRFQVIETHLLAPFPSKFKFDLIFFFYGGKIKSQSHLNNDDALGPIYR